MRERADRDCYELPWFEFELGVAVVILRPEVERGDPIALFLATEDDEGAAALPTAWTKKKTPFPTKNVK